MQPELIAPHTAEINVVRTLVSIASHCHRPTRLTTRSYLAVQAAGEATAGEVMPTSGELVGVAQEPGEAQRVQKSRGSPSGVVGGNESNKELQNAGTDSTLLLIVGSATLVHGTNLSASRDDQTADTETVETADDVTAAIATAAAVETVEIGASEEGYTAPASAAGGEEEQRGKGKEGGRHYQQQQHQQRSHKAARAEAR